MTEHWRMEAGDCRDLMAAMEPASVDAIVTDPPYGLRFMGKDWDHGLPGIPFWLEALRVAKPGAHLLAFGGTRTFHRLTCALEDAGWEIRDVLCWLYGSGFPKSLDVSKAIDKAAGVAREVVGPSPFASRKPNGRTPGCSVFNDDNYVEPPGGIPRTRPATGAAQQWDGWGTALKPAWEPIILARKPLVGTVAANVQVHGTGALNIDATRIGLEAGADMAKIQRQQSNRLTWEGGKASGFAADHVQPIYNAAGRWPANVVLDEEAAQLVDEQSGECPVGDLTRVNRRGWTSEPSTEGKIFSRDGDSGGAFRFFYCAKADRSEREAGLGAMPRSRVDVGDDRPSGSFNERLGVRQDGSERKAVVRANGHPTVKPLDLMRWLVRLVTPPGGLVLDPFAGSGSTGCAAVLEGFQFLGIEREVEYVEIARRRIAYHERQYQPTLGLEDTR